MEPVLSEDAENSCRLINQTLAVHREVAITLSMSPPVTSRLFTGDPDSIQLQRQASLVRLLSITEAFCSERLLDEMNGIVESVSHEGVSNIWNTAYDSAIGKWESQKEAFKNWLGVPAHLWKDVLELAKARNAVAHRYGHLTQLQRRASPTRKMTLVDALRRQKIEVVGESIVLSEESVAQAAFTCRKFIVAVDLHLRA